MSCAYCGADGGLEVINPGGSKACRITELCRLRAAGFVPVQLALTVARGLAKQAWADIEARNVAGRPGSREHAAFRGQLSGTDLARLHVVLKAAAGHFLNSSSADCGLLLAQARTDLGCRTCRAIGDQNCTTSGGNPVPRMHGTWGPRWHAGRTL